MSIGGRARATTAVRHGVDAAATSEALQPSAVSPSESAFRGPVNRMRIEAPALIAGSTDEGVEQRYSQDTLRVLDHARYPSGALTYRGTGRRTTGVQRSEADAWDDAPSASGVRSGLVWASRSFDRPAPEDPRKFLRGGATTSACSAISS
jgi:hypothetical protein